MTCGVSSRISVRQALSQGTHPGQVTRRPAHQSGRRGASVQPQAPRPPARSEVPAQGRQGRGEGAGRRGREVGGPGQVTRVSHPLEAEHPVVSGQERSPHPSWAAHTRPHASGRGTRVPHLPARLALGASEQGHLIKVQLSNDDRVHSHQDPVHPPCLPSHPALYPSPGPALPTAPQTSSLLLARLSSSTNLSRLPTPGVSPGSHALGGKPKLPASRPGPQPPADAQPSCS